MGKPRDVFSRAGFTLVEMLAAVAVLTLIVLAGSALTITASSLLTYNNKHMDANDQARTVFDRMANDFARMSKRRDVDFIFWKATSATPTTAGINDTMYFYTEASGYFDSTTFTTEGIPAGYTGNASEENAYTLAGYRVNNLSTSPSYNQLERLGLPLSWDGGNYAASAGNTHTPGTTYAMAFLTYPPVGTDATATIAGNVSTAFDSSTFGGSPPTFAANFPQVGTSAKNYNDGTDTTYDTIGSQVFRLEYAFQLKDGTLSDKPMMVASNANGIPLSLITSTTTGAHPSLKDDSLNDNSTGSWSVGGRWWDAKHHIGYICVDSSPGYAVWHQIGLQDVAAIIVTIAVIDKQGLLYMKAKGGDLSKVAGVLPDYTPGSDPAYLLNPTNTTSWAYALLPGHAVSALAAPSNLSQAMISQIRIYQRCFYLDNF
jgi:prepilin-type N-terminal cleavage/methylation domain-containing protein